MHGKVVSPEWMSAADMNRANILTSTLENWGRRGSSRKCTGIFYKYTEMENNVYPKK